MEITIDCVFATFRESLLARRKETTSKTKETTSKMKAINSFELPRPKSELGRNSVRYHGPLTWNNVPSEVRSITKIDSVKNKVKACKLENISYEKDTAVGTNSDYFYFYNYYFLIF